MDMQVTQHSTDTTSTNIRRKGKETRGLNVTWHFSLINSNTDMVSA